MNDIHPAPTNDAPSLHNRTEPKNRHAEGERGRADKNTTPYPKHREDVCSAAADFSAMEAALRDACARARHAIFPLIVMLKLYRSVASLARVLMRARIDAGRSHGLGDDLVALLDAIRDAACAHFPDPEMPVMDALAIHRAVVALAGVAHRARAGRRGLVVEAVAPVEGLGGEMEQNGGSGEILTDPAVATRLPDPPPQEGMENDLSASAYDAIEPDGPHCAWRRDHKAERDQRAYELLRTVIEERVYTKIKAANQREREEREALERTEPA